MCSICCITCNWYHITPSCKYISLTFCSLSWCCTSICWNLSIFYCICLNCSSFYYPCNSIFIYSLWELCFICHITSNSCKVTPSCKCISVLCSSFFSWSCTNIIRHCSICYNICINSNSVYNPSNCIFVNRLFKLCSICYITCNFR